jgi:hypothetical protein
MAITRQDKQIFIIFVARWTAGYEESGRVITDFLGIFVQLHLKSDDVGEEYFQFTPSLSGAGRLVVQRLRYPVLV